MVNVLEENYHFWNFLYHFVTFDIWNSLSLMYLGDTYFNFMHLHVTRLYLLILYIFDVKEYKLKSKLQKCN